MCTLCSRPLFPDINRGRSERDKLFVQAKLLKSAIQEHEAKLEQLYQAGEPPCPRVEAKLEELRSQQYELARKI